MIRSLSVLLISLLLIAQSAMAMEFDLNSSGLGLDERLVISSFEKTCGQLNKPFSEITDQNMKNMCEIVLETKSCKSVKKEDLRSCDFDKPNESGSALDLLVGCTEGLFESVKELLKFIWDVMKFAWKSATDSEYRGKKMAQASSYMDSAKLYLDTEYQKAYEETSFPFRSMKAMKKMGGAIAQMIMSLIQKTISNEMTEFSCLNSAAKSKYTCKLIGDIFMPPAVALALIKKGPAALKSIGALGTAFDKMKKSIKKGSKKDIDSDGPDFMDIEDDLVDLERYLKAEGFSTQLSKMQKEMKSMLKRDPPASAIELQFYNNKKMKEIETHLLEDGIPARIVRADDGSKFFEVQIDFTKKSDNPVFNRLKKINEKVGQRRVNFSLRYLAKSGAAGTYQAAEKKVKLGMKTLGQLLKKGNASTMTHEFRHSLFHKGRETGKYSIFYGQVQSLDKKAPDVTNVPGYKRFMSTEELYINSSDIYDAMKGKRVLTDREYDFVGGKAVRINEMSKDVINNSKDLYKATASLKRAAKLSPDRPYTIVTKDGHEVRFTMDREGGKGQIQFEKDGKVHIEPIATKAQQEAFDKVVQGFRHFENTGSKQNFKDFAMPRVTRLVDDIQEKAMKRERLASHQYRVSDKVIKYMEKNNPSSVNMDALRKAIGVLKQGVRENRKGIYDDKGIIDPH